MRSITKDQAKLATRIMRVFEQHIAADFSIGELKKEIAYRGEPNNFVNCIKYLVTHNFIQSLPEKRICKEHHRKYKTFVYRHVMDFVQPKKYRKGNQPQRTNIIRHFQPPAIIDKDISYQLIMGFEPSKHSMDGGAGMDYATVDRQAISNGLALKLSS